MRPEKPLDDPVLKMIHTTILGGTLVFFAVVYFLFVGSDAGEPSLVLRWGWLGIAIVSVFAAGFVRGRIDHQSDAGQVRASGILIWAMAEGAALVGIVSTILTSDPLPAIGATLIGVFLLIYHRPAQLA